MNHNMEIEGDTNLAVELTAGFILLGALMGGLFATGLSIARICQGLACWYHYVMAVVALVIVVCVMASMMARR